MARVCAVVVSSALASAALAAERVYADGPFNFSPFSSQPSPPPASGPPLSESPPAEEVKETRVRNDNPRTTAAGFDPEALERGAKALREINNSPQAKKVFELMRKQEETRQEESAAKKAEYRALQAQHETDRQRVIYEEQKKLAQQQAQTKAQMARYEDELARKRMQAEHESQRARNQELVKMQEESSIRQEQIRRATEEQIQAQRRQTEKERAEIERETIRVKALAEAEGRAHEAKLAEDVNRRLLIERANAEREKWISTINTTFEHIGGGLRAILTDQNKLVVAVGGVTALAAGIYTSRSVLQSYKYYWSTCFVAPKSVQLEIEKMIHKFLWGNTATHVRWIDVYRRKAEGGPGIRTFSDIATASTLRLGWILISDNQSLWPTWMKCRYMGSQSLWQVDSKATDSSTWKAITAVKNVLADNISFGISDHWKASFWNDPWLKGRCPVDIVCLQNQLDQAIGYPLVGDLIVDGKWILPNPKSHSIFRLWNEIKTIPISNSDQGTIGWKNLINSEFSFHIAWDNVINKAPVVCWAHQLLYLEGFA